MENMHKSSVIMVLVAVVLIMSIGYDKKKKKLTINGTSTITSSWDIYIEDIAVNNKTLDAENVSASVDDKLSATFQANLVSPGSSVTYDVTVKNGGNLNAKLDSLTFTDSNNEAILYSYAGINENDVINAGDTQTFTITVQFNNSYTQMPENKKKKKKMILTYVQA